ncbi:MAG: hypothetical protein JSV79_02960 [Armatimonadota bacterium]|nr:MAG: hypothetical protein JSV79_02960 [Armatimonadota bacterium]
MTPEQYLALLDQRMGSRGFSLMPQPPTDLRVDRMFQRREFSLTKFGIVDTFCLIRRASEPLTPVSVEAFSRASFAFALKHKIWIPRGFGGTAVAYPVLVADAVPDTVRQFAERYCPRHWASIEFPVVVDCSSGSLLFYKSTPLWGAAYYRGLRRQSEELFHCAAPG